MNFVFFLLRLLALPLMLAFFLAATVVYIVVMTFAWVLLGDPITVYAKYPDWKP